MRTLSRCADDDPPSHPLQDAARLLPEGCPALAAEFEHSGTRRLLIRDAFLRLRGTVMGKEAPELLTVAQSLAAAAAPATGPPGAPPAKVKHLASLVLEGDAGSGKSVLLAQLVAAARSAGWLVLYIPRGRSLTERSSFARHGDSASWDTPEHAKSLLLALDAAHGATLATLPRKSASQAGPASAASAPAGVLRDLVAAGTAPTATAAAVVDAALTMLAELALVTDVPVLFAIDELNALSGFSEYHQVTGPKSRTRLEAGALRIAAALRRFEDAVPLARGARVGVTSANAGVSPRVHLADVGGATRRAVPRLAEAETRALLAHYGSVGMAPRMHGASPEALAAAAQAMHALCVGSGIALRRSSMLM
jgi:hypothetical protein